MTGSIILREARADDQAACDEICLRTSDSGSDASALHDDPTLPSLVYARPYLQLPEGLGFVVEDSAGVAGYVLGTADTTAFEDRAEAEWWPPLRLVHPDPGPSPTTRDDRYRALIHHPFRAPAALVSDYPAHLHIDLLPRLQGHGAGRLLMDAFFQAVAAVGASGVFLGVGSDNVRAVGFYRHLGLETLIETPGTLWLGRRLG